MSLTKLLIPVFACSSFGVAAAITQVNGTTNQTNVTNGTGPTVTVLLPNHVIFPGEVDVAAPTSSVSTFVLTPPTSTCPTGSGIVSGSLCNSFGTILFYNPSLSAEQVLTNGAVPFTTATQILTSGTQSNWAAASMATVDVYGSIATNGGNVNTGTGTVTSCRCVLKTRTHS